MPLLLDEADKDTQEKVRKSIAGSLTHAVEEVRLYTAAAVGSYLWERDSKLAENCAIALLDWAKRERDLQDQWFSKDWQTRGEWEDFIAPEINHVRGAIISQSSLAAKQIAEFGSASQMDLRILLSVVSIISGQHHQTSAHQICIQLAKHFAKLWKHASNRDHSSQSERDYEGEAVLRQQYAAFVVRCDPAIAAQLWAPIAGAIDSQAEEVAEFVEALVIAEDSAQQKEGFWRVWNDTQLEMIRSHLINIFCTKV